MKRNVRNRASLLRMRRGLSPDRIHGQVSRDRQLRMRCLRIDFRKLEYRLGTDLSPDRWSGQNARGKLLTRLTDAEAPLRKSVSSCSVKPSTTFGLERWPANSIDSDDMPKASLAPFDRLGAYLIMRG
jgi:hypothetical protein